MADYPVVSGRVLVGADYSLRIDVEADGLFLLAGDQRPVAYLSRDNASCGLEGRRFDLSIQRRRLAWELALSPSGSINPIAVARPRLRPSAYRVKDASNRRLSLSRGPRTSRWTLKSERGPITRVQVSELMRRTRDYLPDWLDGRSAAEITVIDGASAVRDPGPLVLLAIATVRAELALPILDSSPAG